MITRMFCTFATVALCQATLQAQSAIDMRVAASRAAAAIVAVPFQSDDEAQADDEADEAQADDEADEAQADGPAVDPDATNRWMMDMYGFPNAPRDRWVEAMTMWDLEETARAGFAVAPNLVIGVNIAEDKPTLQVGGQQREGEVVVRDHVTGLVAIRVDGDSLTPLAVSQQQAQAGLPILVSWRDEHAVVHQAGIIATDANSQHAELGLTHRVDLSSNEKRLGAPVLDSSGSLLGVLVQKDDHVVMLPADSVKRLLVAAQADEPADLYRGRMGIQLMPSGRPAVASVVPDSPAAQAGLQAGDEVTRINGQRTRSHGDVIAMVAKARGGDKITVEIEREGETIQETIELRTFEQPTTTAQAVIDLSPMEHQFYRIEEGQLVPLMDGDLKLDLDDAAIGRLQTPFRDPNHILRPRITGELKVERSEFEESLRKLEQQKAEQQEIIRHLRDRIAELETKAKEQAKKNSESDVKRLEALIEEIRERMEQD